MAQEAHDEPSPAQAVAQESTAVAATTPKEVEKPSEPAPAKASIGSQISDVFAKATQWFRLLFYANPTPTDYLLLLVGLISAIAAGVPFPLLGIVFGQLVDDLNSASCSVDAIGDGAGYQSAVNKKVLLVVYIAIASLCLIYIYMLSWNMIGERLAQRLRETYFRSLLKQEASFFDNLPAGEVSSRLNGDIRTIQAGTSEKVGIYIGTLSFFVTAYIIAFIKDAKLAGTLVSLLPCFMAMSLIGGHYVKKYAISMSNFAAQASALASEALSSMSVVHAFGANARLEEKFAAFARDGRKAGTYKAFASAVQSGLLYFIAFSANALAFWMGSRTIADAVKWGGEDATVGTTYTVIFLLVDATLMISQVAPFLQIFGSAAGAFDKLKKDMEHHSVIDATIEEGIKLDTVSGDIEFRDVSFCYPSRPDTRVLKNVSLRCPAGKYTAIVGLSGSGKSTIAGLAARIYDPNEGEVFLDGHELKSINVRNLRSHISLVQQEPQLLDRSILENIALGLVNSPRYAHLHDILMGPTLAEIAAEIRGGGGNLEAVAATRGAEIKEIVELVQQAARDADAITFITRLEHGFATPVGASGGTLISGGQKQRIAVARALVRDPRIIILDEATAALDSQSEARIQEAIERVAIGKTLISIAHRLSTIKNADNIIVMRDGVILEEGTHAELLAKPDGPYAALVNLQSMKSEEPAAIEPSPPGSSDGKQDSVSTDVSDDEVLNEKKAAEKVKKVEVAPEPVVDDQETSSSAMRKLGMLVRPYTGFILLAICGAICVGGTYPASAVIFGNTVGSLSPCNPEDKIRSKGNLFGLLFFILAIAEFFANFTSWSMFGLVAEKLLYTVRVLSFRSLLEQDISWHSAENRTPATLLGFITNDAAALGSLTGSIVGTLFSILVNLCAAIILTHIMAWRIALVCLAIVPLLLGAGFMQLRALTRFAEKHATAFAKSIDITVEAVNSIRMVAALSLEKEVYGTYRRSLDAPVREIARQSAWANLWLAIAYSLGNFVYALAYWWGAKNIVNGNNTQTQFFIVLLAMLVSVQLWAQMFTLAPDVTRAVQAARRIMKLLDLGSTRDLTQASRSLSDAPAPLSEKDIEASATSYGASSTSYGASSTGGLQVDLNNIVFSYTTRATSPVLNNLTLTIPAGKFAALVGPSGAGKSTVISIIERLYRPSSGTVLIGGRDISRAPLTFRDEISYVPQDSALFDGTIAFNVGLGAPSHREATQAEIEEACKLANVHDVIMSLPDGYQTGCGPNGRQLSGGQRQRVALARALVRKPKLLLLDESTSALDAESERLVQEGLEKVVQKGGCTVVAIAHRLATIRKADVIFLVEDGRVVDQGRHEELVQRSERYRSNVMHQTVDA